MAKTLADALRDVALRFRDTAVRAKVGSERERAAWRDGMAVAAAASILGELLRALKGEILP